MLAQLRTVSIYRRNLSSRPSCHSQSNAFSILSSAIPVDPINKFSRSFEEYNNGLCHLFEYSVDIDVRNSKMTLEISEKIFVDYYYFVY